MFASYPLGVINQQIVSKEESKEKGEGVKKKRGAKKRGYTHPLHSPCVRLCVQCGFFVLQGGEIDPGSGFFQKQL